MKKLIALLLALTMMFALVACGGDKPAADNKTDAPKDSGFSAADVNVPAGSNETAGDSEVVDMVVYGLRNNSWDLAPWKNNGSTGNTIYLQLYNGLLCSPGFGTPLEDMYMDMAESIEYSADKVTATIKLRDYIHDSKGNPIKAEDVVFSLETAPKVAGPYAKIATLIDSMEVVDELTLKINLKTYAPGSWETVLADCPVVSKAWYQSASEDELSNNPATTGAYVVKENISGTTFTLEALDNFWQKDELRTPYQIVNAKQIKCVAISEDAMRVMALENGELDIAWIENTSIPLFEGNDEFNLFPFYMTNPTTIVFDCSESSVFHDNANLRLACLHAIDFEQVRIAASGDFGFQGHDVAPATCGDYNTEWDNEPYYDYDVNVALEYLEKAGYTKDNAPTVHFMCKTMAPQMAAVAVIQNCLAQIGVEVVIDAYDQGLFDTYTSDPAQWDMSWQSGNMATGSVLEAWNWYYAELDENGSVGFVKDAKLQELLQTAKEKNDAESLEAFHDYALSMGYAVNAFNEQAYIVAEKGITGLQFNIRANASLNACTFTDEFVPAE